jgi:hypothetical protein
MEKELIKEYNRIAESIGAYFCSKYFKTDDFYWVADDRIDGPLHVGDYFFSLKDMLDYMRYRYGVNKMFEHYDYALEEAMHDRHPICIRDWKKLK